MDHHGERRLGISTHVGESGLEIDSHRTALSTSFDRLFSSIKPGLCPGFVPLGSCLKSLKKERITEKGDQCFGRDHLFPALLKPSELSLEELLMKLLEVKVEDLRRQELYLLAQGLQTLGLTFCTHSRFDRPKTKRGERLKDRSLLINVGKEVGVKMPEGGICTRLTLLPSEHLSVLNRRGNLQAIEPGNELHPQELSLEARSHLGVETARGYYNPVQPIAIIKPGDIKLGLRSWKRDTMKVRLEG